jgi:hypothetical protein
MWRLHGVGFLELLTGDYQPPKPYRLRTLLFVVAVVAVLVATGFVRMQQGRLGQIIRGVIRLAPEAERRNQEVRDLAAP